MKIIQQIHQIIDTIELLNRKFPNDEVHEELPDAKQKLLQAPQFEEIIGSLLLNIKKCDAGNIEKISFLLGELYCRFQDFRDSIDIDSLIRKMWASYREILPKKVSLNKNPLYIRLDKQIAVKDAYELAVLPDYLIVNDGYRGLIVFDKQLNQVRKITIFPHLIIGEIFTHPHKNELVIYSDQNHCFIWINAGEGTFVIIDLPENELGYPKAICVWQDGKLVFGSRNDTFYVLDLSKKIIKNIAAATIKKKFPSFFKSVHYLNIYHPKAIVINKPTVIFRDEVRQEGTIVDIHTGSEVTFPFDYDFYCFAHYHDRYKYMVICEYAISFIDEKGYYIGQVKPDKYAEFLYTYYFENNGFVTLMSSYNDTSRDTFIRIYKFG